MKKLVNRAILSLYFVSFASISHEPDLVLHLPSQKDNGHAYYHELLYEALEAEGVHLHIVVPDRHIPQKRVRKMVENDRLSLMWLIKTDERDQMYPSIDIGLTDGLIGKRVMLIPKGGQRHFDGIKGLSDLQDSGLAAGLGVDWYDIDVWKQNRLEYYTQDGEWRALYDMLTIDGEVNYFPRGLSEILDEAKYNRHLDIERNLLLVYDNDMKFYFSANAQKHIPVIERALVNAQKNGLMDKLVKKYWQTTYEILQPEERVQIKLELPQ